MRYDAASDRFVPVAWDEAFAARSARELRALPRSEPGRVLHLGPRLERGGVPLPAVRARLRHQQFPRLLEHVPRGDQRRPAAVDRRRQGHGDARGLRPRRRHLLHRPQPRHQPSAHADHAARRVQARRARSSCSIRLRERGLERFAAPQDPVEMLTLTLDADRLGLLSAQGRRRRRRAEGHDEGAAGGR